MCVVSQVVAGWQDPCGPNFVPRQRYLSDPSLAAQMLDVIKRLEAIDTRLGMIEKCLVSEPDKERFKNELMRAAHAQP